MSWNYLPELEEAFSRNSYSDILQLARSRSRHIAAMFYFRDREISACRSSRSETTSPRSGLTIPSAPPTSAGCDPSGASSASAEASLARISRLAARASASPEQNPGSGTRWRALSARFNRRLFLPKTAPCSPREDSEQSLSRWPRWGMMRDGVCWELTISDIRSSASACGYWGCVTASMGKDMTPGAGKAALLRSTYGAQRTSLVCRMLTSTGCWPTVLLCERLMGWPDQWSRSEPLATVKYRQWLLSHGGSSLAA